jgi:hypothetical protein
MSWLRKKATQGVQAVKSSVQSYREEQSYLREISQDEAKKQRMINARYREQVKGEAERKRIKERHSGGGQHVSPLLQSYNYNPAPPPKPHKRKRTRRAAPRRNAPRKIEPLGLRW